MAKQRQRLRTLAQLVCEHVTSLSPRDKRLLRAECGRLTTTNCWWLEYQLAPLVLELTRPLKRKPAKRERDR